MSEVGNLSWWIAKSKHSEARQPLIPAWIFGWHPARRRARCPIAQVSSNCFKERAHLAIEQNLSLANSLVMSEPGQSFDFDVAVVGGGSAGYAAARTAADAGLRVVVIEGGKEVGGLCILRGCMPTKALLYAADVIISPTMPGFGEFEPGMSSSISAR
jgi:hypothetical protein